MDYKEKYKNALERAKVIYQGSYKPDTAATIAETLQSVFPELIKSEDEGIRKAILNYFTKCWGNCKDDVCGIHVEDVIDWLEKQGQKDPCEDCKHPMLNCHNFPCSKKQKYQGKSALEASKEEKVDNSNKVEPRFKENDWITNGKDTIQITMVDTKSGHSGYYRCFEGSHGFGWYVIDIESANKNYHLWTITDAKDGDVLAGFYGTFIFMGESDGYCGVLRDNTFIKSTGNNEWTEGLHPATKEQRDHLFKKIKEVGYKWDSNTKELKKIETIDIPFSAKNSELMEAIYFIPEGFHAEIVDNKVIIKKSDQP